MSHLRLVTDTEVPTLRSRLRLARESTLASEFDSAEAKVYRPAVTALTEIRDALERRDPDALIPALRRLASAGELGRLAALRLEGRDT